MPVTGGTKVYSNNTSAAIPDETTIVSTIVITDDVTIADLNVQVNFTHSRDQDLDVFLISPTGTRIELFTDVGGLWSDHAHVHFELPQSVVGHGVFSREFLLDISQSFGRKIGGDVALVSWLLCNCFVYK